MDLQTDYLMITTDLHTYIYREIFGRNLCINLERDGEKRSVVGPVFAELENKMSGDRTHILPRQIQFILSPGGCTYHSQLQLLGGRQFLVFRAEGCGSEGS